PIPAAASAVTAWAETDRFGLAGFAAWGMKPDAFTWLASHAAAYWASVFGSLLGGNAIAGAATANTRPAARRNVTTLFIGCPSARAAATGMDNPIEDRALTTRKPRRCLRSCSSRVSRLAGITPCLRLRVSAGLRPDFPH